jgi:hypothetical protein
MFKNLLHNYTDTQIFTEIKNTDVQIFPITEDNLDGLFILFSNCIKSGSTNNSNIKFATLHPTLWLGELMDKYYKYIRYVCNSPNFRVSKIEDSELKTFNYSCQNVELQENELESFFIENKFKKVVVYHIVKYLDCVSLRSYYSIRYADMTEKYEERDLKIKEILN